MTQLVNVNDVFKVLGQPTYTYVERQEGAFEKEFSDALDSKGILCLITGPSKTGKTTLYTKVAEGKGLKVLRVRCNDSLSVTDFWKKSLEQVDFEQISEHQKHVDHQVSATGKLGGKIGWGWLAGLSAETSTGISSSSKDVEIKKRILADPSPEHIIKVLKYLPVLLVVEDFHYLNSETRNNIFQQWKIFVDDEVSAVVVGTTHHAVDLAHANKDLIGRIVHVDLTVWEKNDLKKIVSQGFNTLKISIPSRVIDTIAEESTGLPIITQSICLQILLDKDIHHSMTQMANFFIGTDDVYKALHKTAINKYGAFSPIYDRLVRGPNKRTRKYNTYELVLLSFGSDPLKFSLYSDEIDERIKKIGLLKSETPPRSSIDGMFSALASFQKRLGVELLEWSETDQKLYILDPAFLFYIRWRKERNKSPSVKILLEEIGKYFLRLAGH